jgi:hypothetical protein
VTFTITKLIASVIDYPHRDNVRVRKMHHHLIQHCKHEQIRSVLAVYTYLARYAASRGAVDPKRRIGRYGLLDKK